MSSPVVSGLQYITPSEKWENDAQAAAQMKNSESATFVIFKTTDSKQFHLLIYYCPLKNTSQAKAPSRQTVNKWGADFTTYDAVLWSSKKVPKIVLANPEVKL